MNLRSFRASAGRLTCLASLLVAGCTGTVAPPDLDTDLTRATGVAEPIAFDVRGGPTDADALVRPSLTLADATRQALTTSPQLQAAIARVRAAVADADQARLLPNPVLSVTFRFPEGGGKPDIEAGLAADLIAALQRPRRAGAADNRLRAAGGEAVTTAWTWWPRSRSGTPPSRRWTLRSRSWPSAGRLSGGSWNRRRRVYGPGKPPGSMS